MRYTAVLVDGPGDGQEIPLSRVEDFLVYEDKEYIKTGFWVRPTRNHWKIRYDCLDLD